MQSLKTKNSLCFPVYGQLKVVMNCYHSGRLTDEQRSGIADYFRVYKVLNNCIIICLDVLADSWYIKRLTELCGFCDFFREMRIVRKRFL